jgi:hypothetical protein
MRQPAGGWRYADQPTDLAALWAAGTVLAAEDRWLVVPTESSPKCPNEINGRPAQVS